MSIISKLQEFFEPQNDWPLQTPLQFRYRQQIQAAWIGILAFLLPILLYYGNRAANCFRESISHSYYIPFWGDVFVATACAVGVLLIFYRGQSRLERLLAIVGGICAIVISLQPTNGSGCYQLIPQSRIFFVTPADKIVSTAFPPMGDITGKIHLGAAALLFIVLAIFSLIVFTAANTHNDGQLLADNRNKRIRNRIYSLCGILMVVTILALVYGLTANLKRCDAFSPETGIFQPVPCEPAFWERYHFTFYGEWICLALFGFAWFVKGRGGGFLLLDETPDKIISRPWWWPRRGRSTASPN